MHTLPEMIPSVSMQQPDTNTPHLVTSDMKPRISVLGLGYVGAVSTACLSDLGYDVIAVDPDQNIVDNIAAGRSPMNEPSLSELLEYGVQHGRITATTKTITAIRDSDVTMVTLPTVTRSHNGWDLKHLRQAVIDVGVALGYKSRYHLVIFRSTVPPGTTRD